MQITIIVDDKTVYVDGVSVALPNLDWSKFRDLGAAHDDIHAVQFNLDKGQGQIEYCEVMTGEAARPNIKPPNWPIDAATFEKKFGWVLPLYEAQIAANVAQADAGIKAAQDAHAAAPQAGPGAAHDTAMQAAMMAELMALKEANATLQRQVESHTATFQALGEIDLAKP